MRKLSYSLVLFAVAAAAYLAGSWRAPQETVAASAANGPRGILHYRCPMHPDFKSEQSTATCGLCGMALEPVYSDAPAADPAAPAAFPGAIVVSPAQQRLIGVKTAVVEAASGTEQVRVFGRVIPEETRVYRLTAGLEAYISEISGVTTGASVRKGQWLASYSAPEARPLVISFITSVALLEREEQNARPDSPSLATARANVTLTTDRLLAVGMSAVQIEEIRRSRAAATTIKVIAPVDGFVLARTGSVGERFGPGAELFQIADLRRVWILADLPAADADHIKPGTVAHVNVGGRDTGVRARASSAVLPQFDSATQTLKLRLEADNPGFVLRPDMYVDVGFDVPYQSTMTVPADAVVASGLRSHVFVERSAGVFEPREIETGRRYGGRLAVLKGLQPGDRIATAGTFLLDSESRMKAR